MQNLGAVMDAEDNTGNISSRSGLLSGTTDNYVCAYDPTHVHGVSAVTQETNVAHYGYDANRNMTPHAGYALSYASYNLPTTINSPGGVASTSYKLDQCSEVVVLRKETDDSLLIVRCEKNFIDRDTASKLKKLN